MRLRPTDEIEFLGLAPARRRTPSQLQQSAPQAALLMVATSGKDSAFSSVVNLSHFDGANGGTTYTNSCPRGNAFQTSGGSALSTTQKIFGLTSLATGSGASALAATHADYAIGTADFTTEFGVYITTLGTYVLWDMRPGGSNGLYPSIYCINSNLFYFTNSADRITANGVLSANTWHRIAVSRVSGTTRMFLTGAQVGSNYTDGNSYLQSQMVVGGSSFGLGTATMPGFIDEFRMSNNNVSGASGAGRYAANYTLAAAAFPNQ